LNTVSPDAASAGIGRGDHLYLIDGSGYIFRAYHALPPLSRKSDGLPTGAVSGFCNMLWKLLEDTKAGDKPTHLAVIFDAGRINFRNEIYSEYKAHRPDPPDDLIPQFPLTREATRAFGVPAVELEGYEADDLIATYARLASEAGAKVTIVSSDKDLMQLVRDGSVEMLDTMKNKRIGTAEVLERFGVPPSKVMDVQALAGDSIDNVPGVPGIGVKTAAELIGTYGDLETLLARAGEIKQPKRRETLIANAENARLSKKLVALDCYAPVPNAIGEFRTAEPEPKSLLPFLKTMEFSVLMRRAAAKLGVEDPEGFTADAKGPSAPAAPATARPAEPSSMGSPGAVPDRGALVRAMDPQRYEIVTALSAVSIFWPKARTRCAHAFAASRWRLRRTLSAISASRGARRASISRQRRPRYSPSPR
jgi:DNA polymerase-1